MQAGSLAFDQMKKVLKGLFILLFTYRHYRNKLQRTRLLFYAKQMNGDASAKAITLMSMNTIMITSWFVINGQVGEREYAQ